jgi:hypothetical protein
MYATKRFHGEKEYQLKVGDTTCRRATLERSDKTLSRREGLLQSQRLVLLPGDGCADACTGIGQPLERFDRRDEAYP